MCTIGEVSFNQPERQLYPVTDVLHNLVEIVQKEFLLSI